MAITCELAGGLGNMMFQIATAYSLAKDNGDDAKFFLGNHHLPLQGRKAESYKGNIFSRLDVSDEPIKTKRRYFESEFSYNKIPYHQDMTLKGYFQSEKYFKHNREDIIALFTDEDSVGSWEKFTSIHVRRGDYLKFPDQHTVLDMNYYNRAIEMIGPQKNYMVFSDDIGWCKKNFKGLNFIIVSSGVDYEQLLMMSQCENNIIANSSFSWWAAWLNRNKYKSVIAPKNWFGPKKPLNTKDLIPEEWKTI